MTNLDKTKLNFHEIRNRSCVCMYQFVDFHRFNLGKRVKKLKLITYLGEEARKILKIKEFTKMFKK